MFKIHSRSLFSILLLMMGMMLHAQTFYEISYKNPQGNQYYGFISYEDDDNCTMRIIKTDAQKNIVERQDVEYVGVNDDEDKEYTALCPTEKEDIAPCMVFLWDEYDEDEDVVPLITFDLDSDDDFIDAQDFYEIDMSDIDEEYIGQFFDEDEQMYQQIVAAQGKMSAQKQEMTGQLGDGSDIHRTVVAALKEAGADLSENMDEKNDEDIQSDYGNASNSNKGVTIHLVEVVNTEISDIGEACARDYKNIKNQMKGITQALGIQLREYPVVGEEFTREAVEKTLNRVKPSSNDVVFFLYSGHGFRFSNQSSKFPCIYLSTSEYDELDENSYMEMDAIYDEVCRKGARLNIVLSDCCNSSIDEEAPCHMRGTLLSRSNNNFSADRLRDLFINSRGSLLSTSSSPGETSVCDLTGGYFTLSFIRSLRKEINVMNTSPVSWDRLISNTISAARERSKSDGNAQNGLKKGNIQVK
ncbi:MAG: caspase family protein [Prevotella sp.]|nr:caspase family protein [Prevotella sp.]